MFVLKKEGLRLISNHCDTFCSNWGLMALNKVLHSTRFLGYSSPSEGNECRRLDKQRVWFDMVGGASNNARVGLSLKCCLDCGGGVSGRADDGSGRRQVVAVTPPLFRDPGAVHGEEVGLKLVNGNGSCKHGRPLGSHNRSMPEKMVVAVDVDEGGEGSTTHASPTARSDSLDLVDYSGVSGDICDLDGLGSDGEFDSDYFYQPSMDKASHFPLEISEADRPERSGSISIAATNVTFPPVLGSFLAALNKFIADRYSLNHTLSEYYVYEFFRIWNCSRAEADTRVHEFFKSPYFMSGIHPIPGAQHALRRLSTFCNLSVVTSRQNVIKDHTVEWLEKHYPGLFQEIHFGNHFALDGRSIPKSEICRSLGAQVLIDDNPRYALECAEIGIRVLFFDYENSYPWCKNDVVASHPLVTRVKNWEEAEKHIVSWAVS